MKNRLCQSLAICLLVCQTLAITGCTSCDDVISGAAAVHRAAIENPAVPHYRELPQ